MKVSKNIFPLSIMLLVLCLVGFNSCDDECFDENNPRCENYDPCFSRQARPELDFRTYVAFVSAGSPEFTTDTLFPGSFGYFEANNKEATRYEWRIGIDTFITNTEYFNINFELKDSLLLVNNPVPLTLIVEYEPDLECSPNRTGRDSITKLIYFRMRDEAAYIGKWRVGLDGNMDNTHEIEIKVINLDSYYFYDIGISNLYNEGDSCTLELFSAKRMSYPAFKIEGSRSHPPCGSRNLFYGMQQTSCRVENENKIYMSWTELYRESSETFSERRNRTLEGYRVN